jgi:cytochrome c biogenesis protein CcmG/thiol:disulfide interchange protein DsbE
VRALTDYRGRTVLLNIWQTNCVYCADEMPMLNTLQKDKPSIVVIGVSIDNTSHSFKTVFDFAAAHKIDYQLVVDSTSSLFLNYVALSGGSYVLPETFIIGPDGIIQELLQGEQTRQTIEKYLP